MPVLQQKHIIQFETSLTLEEFSGRILELVDFNHHKYISTALITKDFFGDKLSPGKFEIRRKPFIPGLFDVFTGMCPCIEIEFEHTKAIVTIRNGSYVPQLIFVLATVGSAVGYMSDFLAELSFLEIVLSILMVLGISCLIVYLFNGRYRSVIRMVERKLIEQLKGHAVPN